ncbi:MAG: RpiB/LacA/LacB family sugar-phosphate isomerase, partial [Angustibacter sp.]
NSAGVGIGQAVSDLGTKYLDMQLDVNLRATILFYRECAELLKAAGQEHNNALVLSIGARMNSTDEAKAMVRTFLGTEYSGETRHQRRIDMVSTYEQSGTLPPLPGSVD